MIPRSRLDDRRDEPHRARRAFRDERRETSIEAENGGRGVPDGRVEAIFHKGVRSRRGDGHGVRRYLVAENPRELVGASLFVITPERRSAES